MDHSEDVYVDRLRTAAKRMAGHPRRRFGWGRETVAKGAHERRTGVRCLNDVRGHGRRRAEDVNPKLAQDVRAFVEPRCYADPALRSSRVYGTASAGEVLAAMRAKGHADAELPAERTMRDVLNRMGYTLRRVRLGPGPE